MIVHGLATIARGRYFSGGYFQALGTQPIAGRLIERRDDERNAAPVAVLSHQFARRHFADAAAAVGSDLPSGPETFALSLLDPIPAVFTIGVIAAIGVAASFVPLRRVMSIDPAESLRAE